MAEESAWYALFVQSGQENKVKARLDYRFCQEPQFFVPQKEIMERKDGVWKRHLRVLFPGYVFLKGVITPGVLVGMQKIPGLYKLLCTDRAPMQIPEQEIVIFAELLDDHDTICISDAIITGGQVKIISGPLLAVRGEVVSIDQRKGRAKVKLVFLGEERLVDFGLNLLSKDEGEVEQ